MSSSSKTPWTARFLWPWDFQARTLEWVAISFSREASRRRNRTRISRDAFTVWATSTLLLKHPPPEWLGPVQREPLHFRSGLHGPQGGKCFCDFSIVPSSPSPGFSFSQDSSLSYSTSSPSMVLAAWSPSANLPEKVKLWSNMGFLSKLSHYQQVLQCLVVLSGYTLPAWKKILQKDHTSKHVV